MIIQREVRQTSPRALIGQIDGIVADNRTKSREHWGFKFEGIDTYSTSFGNLVGQAFGYEDFPRQKRLRCLIDDLHRRKGKVNTLDLMSYGAFHVSAGLSGKVVGLCDERSHSLRNVHEATNVEFIQGDIHDSRLWARLKAATRESGQFDLIISHPIGAVINILSNEVFYARTLARVYNMLDLDSGIFLTEYAPKMEEAVEAQADSLNKVKGITALHDEKLGAFMLVRGEGSPDLRTFRNIVMSGSSE